MNHYDTLGILPDASADEIKAAFRKGAAGAHPDREGGSTERMQAVNRAYAVLSDPQKRARYDQTGEDSQAGPTIDDRAAELLVSAFEEAIEKDLEPVRHTRERLTVVRSQLQAMQAKTEADIERMRRKIGRTKVKEGATNLVEQLIQRRISACTTRRAQMAEALEANERAGAMLADYIAHPEDTFAGLTDLQRRQQQQAMTDMLAMFNRSGDPYRP